MYRIRRTEEEIERIYPSDKIKSPVHLSIGQEAVSVGVCEALRSEDVVFGTYRGHALYLAKGGNLDSMWAELYGKAGGCGKGKAGSMHLVDVDAGMMGTSAVVGTTIPHAVGYALSRERRGRDTVVAVFFGDGAVEEGVWYESLNFAALKELPVLFVCENNLYSIHTHRSVRQPDIPIWKRASALGVPSSHIADNDVLELYDATGKAAEAIRAGEGPRFLEVETYRWRKHVGPGEDYDMGYRSRDELEPWVENDQLEIVGDKLDHDRREAIEEDVEAEIRKAIEFAEKSPWPDEGELYTDVFEEASR
jgi:TPP-dependent pyruvate/acetoin dehydrogenase alpha subunit